MADKKEWRKHFKELRARIPEDERVRIDAEIAQRVLDLPEYAASSLILPYLSFGAEIETRDIIRAAWEAGKTVALPRCVPGTRDMKWYVVDSFDGLVKSSLGVEEPAEDPTREIDPAKLVGVLANAAAANTAAATDAETDTAPAGETAPAATTDPETHSAIAEGTAASALVLVPGLTFDAQGFRMGYGGGFYDTFLSTFKGVSVGLCRECQFSEQVPALEPHDLAVDLVVTEERSMRNHA